jgi:prepilin-type N-terminal cleavage/methylation domain-containing protein
VRTSRHKPTRGFTLVELLVGATLSAAVMAAVLSSYIYLGRNLARLANQQTLEVEGRRTLGFFAQDVQKATGVTITSLTAPDFSVNFALANNGSGATQVVYYYSQAGATPSIFGNTITVPANSLVRILGTGTAITQPAQVVLRNIVAVNEGCYIRYYDASGNPYDNGSAPYTPITTYASGIKQVELQFNTQLGNSSNGTRTLVYKMISGRLTLRNKPFLQ